MAHSPNAPAAWVTTACAESATAAAMLRTDATFAAGATRAVRAAREKMRPANATKWGKWKMKVEVKVAWWGKAESWMDEVGRPIEVLKSSLFNTKTL